MAQFLEPGYAAPYEKSRVVIQTIPLEKTTSYNHGTADGPEAVLIASQYLELFDEETCWNAHEIGIHTDLSLTKSLFENQPIETTIDAIRNQVKSHLEKDKFVLSIGGEHTISYPVFDAHLQHFKDIQILQIDAHSDLRDEYEGSRWSHACVMRRIADALSNNGIDPGQAIIPIGIRSISEEDFRYMNTIGLKPFYDYALHDDPTWIEKIIARVNKPLYITLDVDGMSPSIMPGTGTPEPGGLSWQMTCRLLQRLCQHTTVVGMDINEIMPLKESKVTEFSAARCIYKFLNYRFCR